MMLNDDWRRALQAERKGDLRAAAEYYRRVCERFPSHPEALFSLAAVAARSGNYAESRVRLQQGLAVAPADAPAWAQLGFVCSRLGELQAAEAALAEAIRLEPEVAALRINRALVRKQRGNVDEAREDLLLAVSLAPGNVLALYNLGNLYRETGDSEGAEGAYRQALAADPRHADSMHNLACLRRDRGHAAEAESLLEALVRLHPRRADAWHNLANVRRARGDLPGARAAYLAALSCGEWALPRYALGTLDLLEGNWLSGWEGYEHRWEANGVSRPTVGLPPWRGEESARGGLLVCQEQGFGDYIQFARFFPLLSARFDKVGVYCPAPLVRLFEQNFGKSVEVFDTLSEVRLAGYTRHVPVMSLGKALQVDDMLLGAIPNPYLRAASPRRFGEGALNIGFTWTGSPTHADNARRSLPLMALARLFSIHGTRWFSLQKGMAEHLEPWSGVVSDESANWQDFADAANSISGLDLVITVCTAQAHLAAALGKRVWLMSRFDADWRWQHGRDDSPWYATLRLFRQRVPGDWEGVIDRIGEALQSEAAALA